MPHRFNFNNKDSSRFKTKDGGYVTLNWFTWKRHIIKDRKRRHLDLNREAIINTLLNYDVKTNSKSEPGVILLQKKIDHFNFLKNIIVPRILVVVIHSKRKIIKTIYDNDKFKK